MAQDPLTTDYLSLVTCHYNATELSGDLLEVNNTPGARWTEVGTVGSVSDGPLTTARGPMGGAAGAAPGFTLANSDGGPYDIRGNVSCTFLSWFRLNTVTTEDNVIWEVVGTIDEDVHIFRIHHRTSPPAANPSAVIILASDDGSGFPNFAIAPGSPFRTTVASSVWQLCGWSYDDVLDELRCYHADENGVEHFGSSTGHPGWGYGATTTMGLGKSNIGTEGNSGLRGDLGPVDWFNGYAFEQAEFTHFYNGGVPRKFPEDYNPVLGNTPTIENITRIISDVIEVTLRI